MASSVSLLNNYNGSLFSFANKDLLLQGLMMKQGTYDLNKSRLEQLRNQVEFLDVAKQEDKEYLDSRINATDDIISKYIQNSDLSNQYLTDQLVAKLEEVVDQPILNAVMSTKTRKIEEANWNAAKERGDGSYSDLNYQVQSRNWQKYMSDGQTGSKYGGGGDFVKFVDIDKLYMSKEFNDYLKSAGVNAEYIVQNGVGQFAALDKYEGTVDTNKLNQAIHSYLGEDGRKQMQVNAIAQFGYGDTQESIDALRGIYDNKKQEYLNNADNRLEVLNSYLSGDITEQERQYYENEKANLENSILDYQSRSFDADVAGEGGLVDEQKFLSLGNTVYSNQKFDDLFNLTYMKPIWKDRELDQVQAKNIEFNEQQRQFDLGFGLRQQQLEINKAQLNLNIAKAGMALDEAGNLITNTAGQGGNLANVFLGEGAPVTEEEADDLNIIKSIRGEYQGAIDGIFNYMKDKGGWTESSTASLERQLAMNNGNFSIGQEFNVGSGRKIKVTEDNINYIQTLSDVANGNNSTLAKLSNQLNSIVDYDGAGEFNWDKVSKMRTSSTPNIYFVKEEGGKYVAKQGLTPGAKEHNLTYIAYKIQNKGWDKLTDNEKMTANYYKAQMASQGMSKEEKFLIQKELYRNIGGNINILKDVESKYGYDPYAGGKRTKNANRNVIIDKGSVDIGEYSIDYAFPSSGLLKEGTIEAYDQTKDQIISSTRSIIERDKIVISPPVSSLAGSKDPENILYNSVRTRLGIPANYKGDITLQEIIKDAKPTGEYKVFLGASSGYDDETLNTMAEKVTGTLKKGDLQSRGVQIYEPKESSYDVSLGTNAAKTTILPSSNPQGMRSGVKSAKAGTPEYYSAGFNELLKNWEQQVKVENPDFNIYQFIQNSPDLSKPRVNITPTSGGYYTIFGNNVDNGIPMQSLGGTVPTDVISNMKVKGDENILMGMKLYIMNKTGVQIY